MVQGSPKYALKSSSQHPAGVISIPNTGALMNHSNHNLSSNNNNNNNNGSIPLLCGQIVAQLNGLLFLVHDLNSPALENSLQASLGSIYGRLQEIVSLVENTKSKVDGSSQDLLKHNEIQKQIKESKQKEEEKIAKHIQEYQRALLQQQQHHAVAAASSTFISKVPSSPLPPSQVLPTLKETLPVAAANSVVTMLKKQGLEATIKFDSNGTNYVNGAELLHHHTSLPDVT
ncbi:CpGbinding proteinlike, partial [Caligus rogercresseyi]